jgi:hypothetical protein
MVIALHSELYPLTAVEDGVAAFSAHAELSVETVGAYHRVSIRPANPAAAGRLAKEFANYVLAAAVTAEGAGPPGPGHEAADDGTP